MTCSRSRCNILRMPMVFILLLILSVSQLCYSTDTSLSSVSAVTDVQINSLSAERYLKDEDANKDKVEEVESTAVQGTEDELVDKEEKTVEEPIVEETKPDSIEELEGTPEEESPEVEAEAEAESPNNIDPTEEQQVQESESSPAAQTQIDESISTTTELNNESNNINTEQIQKYEYEDESSTSPLAILAILGFAVGALVVREKIVNGDSTNDTSILGVLAHLYYSVTSSASSMINNDHSAFGANTNGGGSKMTGDLELGSQNLQQETVPLSHAREEEWGWEEDEFENSSPSPKNTTSADDDDLQMALAMSLSEQNQQTQTQSYSSSIPADTPKLMDTSTPAFAQPKTMPKSSIISGVTKSTQKNNIVKTSSIKNNKPKRNNNEVDDIFASMGLSAKPTFNNNNSTSTTSKPTVSSKTFASPKPGTNSIGISATTKNTTSINKSSFLQSDEESSLGSNSNWDDDEDLDDLLND
eukprot:CAMPEP_0178963366 /NCGR_PEP_ID=MMETSP0789-20121207/14976_1 /TAXON_ID=3005 /ORGANISM="Rhizosolenia setigera, Strain CCMP 1694" /LENGTH=472 /DNA_ID=CAMNT_0020647811 /DNA_START=68 /DNA_END=1486 /DNA_ORIENTATION=-